MNGHLVIDFRAEEGAVGRIVGLVERRGFELRGISMTGGAERGFLTLEVEARDSGRRLDVLDLQLRRLGGIGDVSIYPSASDPGQ
jgi:acetolactate synthase-1/3 small subunit/acetolactate synthase II small subunit